MNEAGNPEKVPVSVEPLCWNTTTMPEPAHVPDRFDAGAVPTVTMTSFDAPLTPVLAPARTRTKYVPLGTPLAENVVAVDPVLKLARLFAPLEEPASITYDVAGSGDVGTSHVSVTVLPLTDEVRFGGAVGAAVANSRL